MGKLLKFQGTLFSISAVFLFLSGIGCTNTPEDTSTREETTIGDENTEEATDTIRLPDGVASPVTIEGVVTKKNVTFTVYLPEGYNNGKQRYPVIYHLHGIGGAHDGNQKNLVPESFRAAKNKGLIDDVIIVFPDGYKDSFWADSYTGDKPAETNLIKEIIPFMDKHFRSIADANHRFIQGFSMGGFGALKFFTKYPDMFAGVYIYDAALLQWNTIVTGHQAVARDVFNNDRALFESEYSPWTFAVQNQAEFKGKQRIGIAVGALVNYNEQMHELLTGLDIPHSYTTTSCDHNIACLLQSAGEEAAAFFAGN
ncbi:MAG: esterase family protein [Prevotellaceae bacterium]|nr:esterase family protein [Prevotellaceae bacterium]